VVRRSWEGERCGGGRTVGEGTVVMGMDWGGAG